MNNNPLFPTHLYLRKKCFDYLENLIKIVKCDMDLEFLLNYLIKKEVCCDSIFVYVPEKYYNCNHNQPWKDYIEKDVKNSFKCDICNNYKDFFNDDPYGAYVLYCVTDNKCSNNKNYKVLYIGMSGKGEDQRQGVFGRLINTRSYVDCNNTYTPEGKIEDFINNALCCRCEGKKLGVALLLVKKNDVDTAKELEEVLCQAYYRKNSKNPPAQSKC